MEKDVKIERVKIEKVVEITTIYKDKETGNEYCIQEYWRQDGKKIGEVGPKIDNMLISLEEK